MNFTRRKFLIYSGTFVAGSGLFMLGSCEGDKPRLQKFALDYVGPHEFFRDFRDMCKGIRAAEVSESSFEQALSSPSRLSCLAEPLSNRAAKVLMLLEQGKDVLVLPPLATNYDEFNAIQLQCNTANRKLALINPFRYYPSFREFKKKVSDGSTGRISSIEISINPGYTIPYLPPLEGMTGPALLLISTLNEILASFPLTVSAQSSGISGPGENLKLEKLAFEYQDSILNCFFSPGTGSWNIKVSGEKDNLLLRDNGEMLSDSNGTLIQADRQIVHDSLRNSLEDFIESVRESREPESNSVEGLMQITINRAVWQSIDT